MNLQHDNGGMTMTMSEAKLLAFHGKPEVKEYYLARVRAHRAADEIVRGRYWDTDSDGVFRGCAVGCTLHSSRHQDYEPELGIPQILAWLEDGIFEGLPHDRNMAWPEEFLMAPQVGADLSLVWPQFVAWMLTDAEHGVLRFAETERSKSSIQAVADVYAKVVAGEVVEWLEIQKNAADAASASAAAYAAADAAYAPYAAYAAADAAYAPYAAYAAADAASYASAAAYAAADAASASAAAYAAADAAATRKKIRVAQADKLLELMAAAPVSKVAV
jgi:hypothetical protein